MDKSIAQTLNVLIPTLPGPLPPELLELAKSLLAQSRNKANNLKAEEEIARSYVCAHLACERLKQSLSLPKIQPNPPCKPNIYKKLYRHLDSVLQANTRRSTRALAPSKLTSKPTPSPAKRNPPTNPPHSRPTPTKTRASHHPQPQPHTTTVPEWVMPSIRLLCTALHAPATPPHIFAGVSSILTLPAPNPIPKSLPPPFLATDKIPSLIVAIALMVYTRLSGVPTPAVEYARQKALGLAVLGECMPEDVERNLPADVDAWLREIRDRGWALCDWFKNVPEGVGVGVAGNLSTNEDNEAQEIDDEDNESQSGFTIRRDLNNGTNTTTDDDGKTILMAGLGTMMQETVDFLHESRCKEFRVWKKDFLRRVAEGERGVGG